MDKVLVTADSAEGLKPGADSEKPPQRLKTLFAVSGGIQPDSENCQKYLIDWSSPGRDCVIVHDPVRFYCRCDWIYLFLNDTQP